MKVFKVRGFPADFWFVSSASEFSEIRKWLYKNNISYMHMTSGSHGYGFKITGGDNDITLFTLTWAGT